MRSPEALFTQYRTVFRAVTRKAISYIVNSNGKEVEQVVHKLPACRRLLFPLLHAEKGRLRNAVANRVPASHWQGILFRINCEIISG